MNGIIIRPGRSHSAGDRDQEKGTRSDIWRAAHVTRLAKDVSLALRVSAVEGLLAGEAGEASLVVFDVVGALSRLRGSDDTGAFRNTVV